MSGIGLVHNPNAKKNKNQPELMEKYARILGDFGMVRVTQKTDEITEVAREFLDREIDILMINGGDGTCHLTLTKFIEVYAERELPFIVHMRCGTMNTIAHALDTIKGTPENIVSTVADKYRRNEPFALIERNIIKANNWYGFIIGSGLVANFIEAYYEGEERGPIKAIKVTLKGISSAIVRTNYAQKLVEPVQAKIWIADRKLFSTRYTVILASSINEIGLGFKPTYLGGERDGFFHFVCGNVPGLEIVKNLPRLRLGRPIKTRELYDEVCNEVTIKPETEFKCMVDGDVYRCMGDVKITTGPRLRFIKS